MTSWFESSDFDASNLNFFMERLNAAVDRLGMDTLLLGEAFGFPIQFVTGCRHRQGIPHLLIASGVHGEEQAGPWALLRYMEIVPLSIFEKIDIGFLPMVNPTGFMRNTRFNLDGDSPNTGFINPAPDEHLSVEGKILMSATDLLVNQATEGFLTLHEQTHASKFYTYALERQNSPSNVAYAIRDAGGMYFSVIEDGLIPPPGGGVAVNGVVLNEHDGTLEDMLFRSGALRCYTTETPVSGDFSKRVQANLAVIRAFVLNASGVGVK